MCPDCPDQSCLDCQTHLRDAQAFDQMADRMLQAARSRPGRCTTATPSPTRSPARPAADQEAGQ